MKHLHLHPTPTPTPTPYTNTYTYTNTITYIYGGTGSTYTYQTGAEKCGHNESGRRLLYYYCNNISPERGNTVLHSEWCRVLLKIFYRIKYLRQDRITLIKTIQYPPARQVSIRDIPTISLFISKSSPLNWVVKLEKSFSTDKINSSS